MMAIRTPVVGFKNIEQFRLAVLLSFSRFTCPKLAVLTFFDDLRKIKDF